MIRGLKKSLLIVALITTSLFVFSSARPAYALPNCDLNQDCGTDVCDPKPSQIICPFLRIINFFFIIVGIVFAVMIGVGAIKIATSLG